LTWKSISRLRQLALRAGKDFQGLVGVESLCGERDGQDITIYLLVAEYDTERRILLCRAVCGWGRRPLFLLLQDFELFEGCLPRASLPF
jgi:hypothetical protein